MIFKKQTTAILIKFKHSILKLLHNALLLIYVTSLLHETAISYVINNVVKNVYKSISHPFKRLISHCFVFTCSQNKQSIETKSLQCLSLEVKGGVYQKLV